MLLRIFSLMFWAMAVCSSAYAEPAYKDNRSTAGELVRSLYDAINRHEYARAYDYFAVPPAKDFEAFASGYADTERVDVIMGEVSSDGTAGTTFHAVPVVIKATDTKGGAKVFAGCYMVREVNAENQGTPFRPLQIDKGVLKPAGKDDFSSSVLPKCADAADVGEAADVIEASVDDAKALFAIEQKGHCDKVEQTLGGVSEPQIYVLKYHGASDAATEPDRVSTLYAFDCSLFAYNTSEVYYLHDNIEGLRLLSFAEPHLLITHPPDDDEGKILKSMTVDGFTSSTELINSGFDEKTRTIGSFNKWRGVADASSTGTWTFKNGEFVLTYFAADPTYNGEVDPITVMKDGKVVSSP
jgi:hypothetical protein